jgi:type IV secretory pathway VirJ component
VTAAALMAVALLAARPAARTPAAPAPAAESFTFGAAGRVALYAPKGPPASVVLLLSGDGGWNLGVVPMAERLRGLGALVVGIDIRTFLRNLGSSSAHCAYPAGDLEELSRAVQLREKLPAYLPPILVGYSSGATLVYAALAAAPPETFAGAISLGFCPDLEIQKPLCHGRALAARRRQKAAGFDLEADPTLTVPWYVMQGDLDQVCEAAATHAYAARIPTARLVRLPKVGHGFSVPAKWEPQLVDAYRSLAAATKPPAPGAAEEPLDLPLVEVPAAPRPAPDVMAVVVSGDGGWAALDRGLGKAFAARGIPVVGWNSLRYFWSPRTPEAAARDLDRILRHYLATWGKKQVLLVGYSFGANVLPFMASRLPAETRARVAGIGLVGLGTRAAFEFHVTNWLGGGGDGPYRTVSEIDRLKGLPVACVQGADETDSACGSLPAWTRLIAMPGGHHFGGDYASLGAELLAAFEKSFTEAGAR